MNFKVLEDGSSPSDPASSAGHGSYGCRQGNRLGAVASNAFSSTTSGCFEGETHEREYLLNNLRVGHLFGQPLLFAALPHHAGDAAEVADGSVAGDADGSLHAGCSSRLTSGRTMYP